MRPGDDYRDKGYADDLDVVWLAMSAEANARNHPVVDVAHLAHVALYEPTVVEILIERSVDVDALRVLAEAAFGAVLVIPATPTDLEPLVLTDACEQILYEASSLCAEASQIALGHVLQALGGFDPDDVVARSLGEVGAEHVVRTLVARLERPGRVRWVSPSPARAAGYRQAIDERVRVIVHNHAAVGMDEVLALLIDVWKLHATEARLLMLRVHRSGSADISLAMAGGTTTQLRARTAAFLRERRSLLPVEWPR